MKFWLHHPPLGPLGPMMYPPAVRGGCGGRYMLSRTQTNPHERIAQGGGIPQADAGGKSTTFTT